MRNLLLLCVTTLITSLSPALLHAGEIIVSKSIIEVSPFEKGGREFQLGGGAWFALNENSVKRPSINDAGIYGRYGWMLTSPLGGDAWSGNWEFLLDAGVAGIFDGPGDVLAELVLLLRYNFIPADSNWVPYIQIGAGGAYSDIPDEPHQRVIGSDFSFNLQGAIGVRYLFSNHSAIYLEGGYRHISNAGLSDRNLGLNSLGAQIGYSWFF